MYEIAPKEIDFNHTGVRLRWIHNYEIAFAHDNIIIDLRASRERNGAKRQR